MFLNWKQLLSFLLLAFLFSSCYSGIAKQVKNEIQLEVKRDYTIKYDTPLDDEGLGQLFKKLPNGKTMNIIITHGIGTASNGHFDRFNQLLVKGLSYSDRSPSTGPTKMVLSGEQILQDKGVAPPAVDTSSYLVNGRKVFIYNVNWSVMTQQAKDFLISALDTNSHRTALATKAKQVLLIDALGDLSLYLSDYHKDAIKSPFIEILEELGGQEEGNKTIFIGGSTGNQIFLDALEESDPGPGLDLCRIYMLSNQLPFTAQLTMKGKVGEDKNTFVKHIYQPLLNYQKKHAGRSPHIISFYDPNDVFGYKLPRPEEYGIEGLAVQNVKVYNTLEWSFNPEQLRNKYLTVMDNKAQKAVFQHLHQHTDRQKIKVDVGRTSKLAKQNLAILGGIIKGSGYDTTNYNSSFTLVSYSKNGEKSKLRKTKVGEKKAKFRKVKKNFWVQRLVTKWANNQIAKANFDPGIQLPFEYPSHTFDSLDNQLAGIQKSVEANRVTNVLTMHGMRPKEPDHFDKMVTGIAQQLEFDTIPKNEKTYPFQTAIGKTKHDPAIIVREYMRGSKRLRFFIVYWSPVTMPTKKTLHDLERDYLVDDDRSFILDMFKQAIVNDGLSDIPLASRAMKDELHELLDMAFSLMLKADPFQPNLVNTSIIDYDVAPKNNYLITSSLGSGLMMDYLLENMQGDHQGSDVANVLKQTDKVFMLTNQLPILAFKNLEGPLGECSSFTDQVYGNWKLEYPTLNIVAFNDPNDVLGFRLPEPKNLPNVHVRNLTLNIADGYQANKFYTAKLVNKMDRVFKKMIDKEALDRQRKHILAEAEKGDEAKFWKNACIREMDLKSREYDNFISTVAFLFFDNKKDKDARQKLVIRVDNAHEAPSHDHRMFELLAKGTEEIKKTSTDEMKAPGCE